MAQFIVLRAKIRPSLMTPGESLELHARPPVVAAVAIEPVMWSCGRRRRPRLFSLAFGPARSHSAFSMRRCSYCGKEYEDTVTVCLFDQKPVMPVVQVPPQPSVEFIRLFFKSPQEEEFAIRCARFIARVAGGRVSLLRPDTTWAEIFRWQGPEFSDAAMFLFLFTEEFGAAAYKEVVANYEFMTFRDFVEYACRREHRAAIRIP